MQASVEAAVSDGEMFDKEITGFSIDSRSVQTGELFFALSPEDYARHCFTATSFGDAHRFIPQALADGALAVVARRSRVEGNHELDALRGQLLLVDDVIEALQMLAHEVLRAWGRPVISITGSAGKTTTKDLTAHVFAHANWRVLKSRKNFNNELGVPLSILQMETAGAKPDDYDVAVLEMGMSMPKELQRLCQIAPPDVGVELLIAPVHMEFFGTIERIAAAKAELIEGLKPDGTAVLNADDELVAAMRAKHRGRVITFGIEQRADVTATNIESAQLGLSRFRLRTPHGEADAVLQMPGEHNLMNALAAAAVATIFDITPEEIARALATATPSEMRGEVLRFAAGFTVVDDSYNSNPRALLSMAQSVTSVGHGGSNSATGGAATANASAPRRIIIVAGEMLELGPESAEMHREAGREIALLKVDLLWGVRGHAHAIIEGARAAGMGEAATAFFETSEDAALALADEVRAGDLVMVKGSRGVQTDKVVKLLRERYEVRDER